MSKDTEVKKKWVACRLPIEVYKRMKVKLAQEGISTQDMLLKEILEYVKDSNLSRK